LPCHVLEEIGTAITNGPHIPKQCKEAPRPKIKALIDAANIF